MRPWSAELEHKRNIKAARKTRLDKADAYKDEHMRRPCSGYCGGVNHVNCTFIDDAVASILRKGESQYDQHRQPHLHAQK